LNYKSYVNTVESTPDLLQLKTKS